MKTSTIEDLAYLIKQAHEQNLPKPIIFLGAGASKTGKIPLAGEIVSNILDRYKDNPKIKKTHHGQVTYRELMDCLTPYERNNLLKGYIDNAKINVTHIYLAQLINQGYIDYVLTVNFDNLMLRACALYNEFPPTYDMAILKNLTTTSFKEKSVLYLHGQHHGLWLLNTDEELKIVENIIPPILNKISNQRAWIFIGYSGEDPIFEHIINLGRFDNGLYWVAYNENDPNENVCNKLLNKPNTNATVIKGYDSDTFMIKLSNELELPQPYFIDKPFTSLKRFLNEIVDIEDKDHFKGVKERLKIVKDNVDQAISQFEVGNTLSGNSSSEATLNLLKKRITDNISTENYSEIELNELEKESNKVNKEDVNILLGDLFFNAANKMEALAKQTNDELFYYESKEKYEKAIVLNPNDYYAYNNLGNLLSNLAGLSKDENRYLKSLEQFEKAAKLNPNVDSIFSNWGIALSNLAQLKNDDKLYDTALEKFKTAVTLNPNNDFAFYNWGTVIGHFAELKQDENLYRQAIDKFDTAISLNPRNAMFYENLGNAYFKLAQLKKDESLYLKAFEKYEKALELRPNNNISFYNLANAISNLAKLKNDEALYIKSFTLFKKAIFLNPNDDMTYQAWGNSIANLAKLKNDSKLFTESLEILNKAVEMGGFVYNLACAYAKKKDKQNALRYLDEALRKCEIKIDYVQNDEDWEFFQNDDDFLSLIAKYKSSVESNTK